MNRDFVEMLAALSAAEAEFLVVGAYALAVHGRPHRLELRDLETPDVVFQIGLPPSRIDVLTSISGVTFDEAWGERTSVLIEGIDVPVLGRDTLIRNKLAAARPRDLADVAELRDQRKS